jgi:hypothetical protein
MTNHRKSFPAASAAANASRKRKRHRDQNPVDRAHGHHTQRRDQRQSNLETIVFPDFAQRSHVEQRECREDQHCPQRGDRHILQRFGKEQEHRRDGCRCDQPGHLRAPAGGNANCRAWVRAGYGKAL